MQRGMHSNANTLCVCLTVGEMVSSSSQQIQYKYLVHCVHCNVVHVALETS